MPDRIMNSCFDSYIEFRKRMTDRKLTDRDLEIGWFIYESWQMLEPFLYMLCERMIKSREKSGNS